MWQRFKQMRESQGGQNRDERQKREQAREEKELAKFAEKYVDLIDLISQDFILFPVDQWTSKLLTLIEPVALVNFPLLSSFVQVFLINWEVFFSSAPCLASVCFSFESSIFSLLRNALTVFFF